MSTTLRDDVLAAWSRTRASLRDDDAAAGAWHGSGPAAARPYRARRTRLGHLDPRTGAADLYRPVAGGTPVPGVAGVVLAPGWLAPRWTLAWFARRLAEEGFAVLLVTPPRRLLGPARRARSVAAAVDALAAHPAAAGVDAARTGAVGYSMGAGAVLRAAATDDRVRAVVGWYTWDTRHDYDGDGAPTLLVCARIDLVAPPRLHTRRAYASLTDAPVRVAAQLRSLDHLVPMRPESRLYDLTVAWLKVHLDGDRRYLDVLDWHDGDERRYTAVASASTPR